MNFWLKIEGKKNCLCNFGDNLKKYFNKREREKDVKKEIEKGNKLKEKRKKRKIKQEKNKILS